MSSKESVKLEFRPLPGNRKELRDKTDMNQQSVLDQQNDIMALMVEQHQASLLPPLMLPKFSCDPIEYNTFIRRFESQIKRRLSSNDTRLQYLEQYLESEPKDLIKGCLHVDANKGYLETKRLLQEKYGDPEINCFPSIQRELQLPKISFQKSKWMINVFFAKEVIT